MSFDITEGWAESAYYNSGSYVPFTLYAIFLIVVEWIRKNVH